MMENGVGMVLRQASGEATVGYYTGIDVSLELSHVCVMDTAGTVVKEAKVASDPDALVAWFVELGLPMERIGLEAGPLSQWLYAGLTAAKFPVVLLETRQVRDAFRSMPVKTDRKDAGGIAQLLRLGWFRPVHCKSQDAQQTRVLLTARKALQSKWHDIEMCIRGVLRGFGLKVGPTTRKSFEPRVRDLVSSNPAIADIADALLKARAILVEQFRRLDTKVIQHARHDERAQLLMTVPGVGTLIATTFVAA
ncbi:IS110 family transposase, partial [Sandarakinorhabdus sp.]|uniref:IS110 family transposase n=1 Tax=Sandarakinorhabdus sp. TaxID=1916663 RepID=UPI0028A8527A